MGRRRYTGDAVWAHFGCVSYSRRDAERRRVLADAHTASIGSGASRTLAEPVDFRDSPNLHTSAALLRFSNPVSTETCLRLTTRVLMPLFDPHVQSSDEAGWRTKYYRGSEAGIVSNFAKHCTCCGAMGHCEDLIPALWGPTNALLAK